MKKIKIITDSTADLPQYIVDKYDIEVLPLLVNFGEESFKDGIDIHIKELLDKIDDSEMFPGTAQVNPQRFLECYKSYLDQGYKIVSIHLSSKMSGTYQSASIAKDMLDTDDIVVIDSVNVTSGLGLLVIKAAMLKENGHDIKEIEDEIKKAIPHVRSVIAFESLDNLVKGGRLSKTAGIIGNILGIKIILSVKDGEMAVIDKVRGSKKALRYLIDYVEKVGIKENEPCIFLHVDNEKVIPTLRESLGERNNEFIECEVGCVVGVHAGRGGCAIFFFEEY